MPVITAKCPECGSDEIRELSSVIEALTIVEWEKSPDGVRAIDYGGSKIYGDCGEFDTYDCADCGSEFMQPIAYIDGVKVESAK